MNKALEDMLRIYQPVTPFDWLQATREVVQEIVLLGFWRSGFFNHVAFYGGTALRIFHGLERFSEDLDFSVLDRTAPVRLESALSIIKTELASWGFSFEAQAKSAGPRTGIESAFLKGNTRINLLNVGVDDDLSRRFPNNQKISIKLELETNTPAHASTEVQTSLMPTPFQVRLYDLPSLFAGKLHALLFRNWKSRVKGRDFYDFIWYVSRDVPVNLPHLEARITDSGNRDIENLDIPTLRMLLKQRFESVDINAAAEEVRPFLRDPRQLALWSEEFFVGLAARVSRSA
jgi:predicted nucleotidyltransferase component of viral defense system